MLAKPINYVGLISPEDATQFDIAQLTPSGCGVTALLNVLLTLKAVSKAVVHQLDWSGCILNARNQNAPLPEYLLSRSKAGCTGADLVHSMATLVERNREILQLTTKKVSGYFVSFREICSTGLSLSTFCATQLAKGNCLVATFNLQLLGNDAWHHQAIYGVDKDTGNIHCLNPHCQYSEKMASAFLSTESVLLVRREDVIERYGRRGGDHTIYEKRKWKSHKVSEQIEFLIRNTELYDDENTLCKSTQVESSDKDQTQMLTHIVIPAEYVGGLCVFSCGDM